MLPTQQVEGLIPKIQEVVKSKVDLQNDIGKYQELVEKSNEYQILQSLKFSLKQFEEIETQLREQGKQIMLDNGLKKFEMLDGTTIQLNATPGALVVAEGVQLDKKYYKEKTTVTMDKVKVKADFMEGLILDPGVSIESEYKFIIKQK